MDTAANGTNANGAGVATATGAGVRLLYTSDAAAERTSVDLGGRRITNTKTCRDR